jgi:hypothetical protein
MDKLPAMFSSKRVLLVAALLLPGAAFPDGKTRFRISYPASVSAGPLTGRA